MIVTISEYHEMVRTEMDATKMGGKTLLRRTDRDYITLCEVVRLISDGGLGYNHTKIPTHH